MSQRCNVPGCRKWAKIDETKCFEHLAQPTSSIVHAHPVATVIGTEGPPIIATGPGPTSANPNHGGNKGDHTSMEEGLMSSSHTSYAHAASVRDDDPPNPVTLTFPPNSDDNRSEQPHEVSGRKRCCNCEPYLEVRFPSFPSLTAEDFAKGPKANYPPADEDYDKNRCTYPGIVTMTPCPSGKDEDMYIFAPSKDDGEGKEKKPYFTDEDRNNPFMCICKLLLIPIAVPIYFINWCFCEFAACKAFMTCVWFAQYMFLQVFRPLMLAFIFFWNYTFVNIWLFVLYPLFCWIFYPIFLVLAYICMVILWVLCCMLECLRLMIVYFFWALCSLDFIFVWIYENIIVWICENIVKPICTCICTVLEYIYKAWVYAATAVGYCLGAIFAFIFEYILKPIYEYILTPIGKAIAWVGNMIYEYILVPIKNALEWIWDNVIAPILRAIAAVFRAIGSAISSIF